MLYYSIVYIWIKNFIGWEKSRRFVIISYPHRPCQGLTKKNGREREKKRRVHNRVRALWKVRTIPLRQSAQRINRCALHLTPPQSLSLSGYISLRLRNPPYTRLIFPLTFLSFFSYTKSKIYNQNNDLQPWPSIYKRTNCLFWL